MTTTNLSARQQLRNRIYDALEPKIFRARAVPAEGPSPAPLVIRVDDVIDIIASREDALREEIAAEVEAAGDSASHQFEWLGFYQAGRIVRGQGAL